MSSARCPGVSGAPENASLCTSMCRSLPSPGGYDPKLLSLNDITVAFEWPHTEYNWPNYLQGSSCKIQSVGSRVKSSQV